MDVAHCYLDGHADAVEFCPHEPFHHVLAASTYNLQEGEKPSRSGSLSLFKVGAGEGQMNLIHQLETCGIFDIKWSPVESSSCPLLGQADADGYLRVYKLQVDSESGSTSMGTLFSHFSGEPGPSILIDCIVLEQCDKSFPTTLYTQGTNLREAGDVKVSTSMCLYLDWNPSATSITLGLSDGSVSLVSMTESGLTVNQQWKAHQFEVWTSSFDCHLPNLVYTGSDDCKFCGWDLRDGVSRAAFQNSKAHSAGVCCIVKNPSDPNILLTGSYDEYLREWDMRSLSKPVNETSLCLGGGVWRIKYHPSIPGLVLTACMHNGFAIVDTNSTKFEIIETYMKHESLAYGADWQRPKNSDNSADSTHVVATCSFYDRLLRVWKPQFESGA